MLTTIGYINWWEGRGSKAHQYMHLALDTDPGYRFARLTDQCSEPASSPPGTPQKHRIQNPTRHALNVVRCPRFWNQGVVLVLAHSSGRPVACKAFLAPTISRHSLSR
ncbi:MULTISPECIES: hypothetical protein [unclassified Arthrobacter]|uniref:hypothetical protein n=1 Tax=unclassified Arthrobacter TaxID=235627 RepID=UPI0037BF7A80